MLKTNGVRAGTVKSAFASVEEVVAAMQDKLAESCLFNGDAEAMGLQPYTASQVRECVPINPHRAGFLIPYPELDGTMRDDHFWRFRYLEYKDLSGIGALTEDPSKKLRYMQPADTTNELYLPAFCDWAEISDDPTKTIVITEGELKAACACKHGIPTIGLGGVDCWQKDKKALPMFDAFLWTERNVVICYDSDAATNLNITRAIDSLGKELLNRGCKVFVAHLPHLEGGAKCGMDDYIRTAGSEAMVKVIETADAHHLSETFHKINTQARYVNIPPCILHLPTMQLVNPKVCSDHLMATERHIETKIVQSKEGKQTPVLVDKSAVSEWIKWKHRATVQNITYLPSEPRETKGMYNMWSGWGVDPVEGDVNPWHELMDHLFHDAPEEDKDWFQKWLAYPIQHPGVKMSTAAVIWGLVHGAGKSAVGYTMMKIYGTNASEIKDSDLNGNFNEWAKHKQFIMADEITGGDKRVASDRMKSIITQEWVLINAKYQPAYAVPDCINYYFTSNHPDAFFLEDTDRRFFVHEVTSSPLPDSFYTRFHQWRDRERDGKPCGAAHLMYYFQNFPLGDFNPKSRAPDTKSKIAMISDGRSDIGSWVAHLKDDPASVLRMSAASPVMRWTVATAEDLHRMYDPEGKRRVTVGGLAKEMKRQGFRRAGQGNSVRVADGRSLALWVLVFGDERLEDMSPTELAVLYDTERKTNLTDVRERKY